MKRHVCKLVLASLVLFAGAAWPPPVAAESPIQLNGEGRIALGENGSAVVVQSGTATHLGTYVSYEEVVFVPDDEDGDLHGAGLIAFVAANGDMLVGVTTWLVHGDGTTLQSVKWRDTVTFADGTTVASTGRFAETRPPGAGSECTTNWLTGLVTCKATKATK